MTSFRRIYLITTLSILSLLTSVDPALAEQHELDEFTIQSRKYAADFMASLKRMRRIDVETVGVSSTLETCGHHSPQLYYEFSVKNNIVLRRVSLAPRNPVLGSADAWEQAGLLKMQKMLKDGVKPDEMEIVELVQEPANQYFRYLQPIIAEPGCLKCHGSDKDMAMEASDALKLFYPKDRANGYKDNDLVGAISIKRAKGVAAPRHHAAPPQH